MKFSRHLAVATLLASSVAACAPSTKDAWQESGSSWRGMGNQFRRALGMSIQGEGNLKEEWKDVGRNSGEAGRDTAEAVGKSIVPDERRRPAENPSHAP